MDIQLSMNVTGLDAVLNKLEAYSTDLNQKMNLLCERLAEKGLWYAEWNFSGVDWTYSGNADYAINVEKLGDAQYAVSATGAGVLFLEFGAGATLGYGHPQADQFGMGPGTYPGQKHAFDPKGWWYVGDDGIKVHTYGNAPGMPMYNTAQDLRKEIAQIAQEVFGTT